MKSKIKERRKFQRDAEFTPGLIIFVGEDKPLAFQFWGLGGIRCKEKSRVSD